MEVVVGRSLMSTEQKGGQCVACLLGIALSLLQMLKLLLMEALLIENGSSLTVDTTQARQITVSGGCIGTADGLLIAVEGHGSLVHVSVAAAQEVVGQHLVVRRAMTVEIISKGLCLVAFLDGEHGVGSVQLVQRIKPLTHLTVLIAACAATESSQQHQDDTNLSHISSKGTN